MYLILLIIFHLNWPHLADFLRQCENEYTLTTRSGQLCFSFGVARSAMPSGRSRGPRDALSSTAWGLCVAYLLTVILSISFPTPVSALHTVPGSPCESTCNYNNLNFANDTVCLDTDYQNGDGRQFRECTTCLLNSTAVDTASNISDVYWGLCKREWA